MARRITTAALSADALAASFPHMDLPITPPFPPMDAATADTLPHGEAWRFEPKWDGFRCLAFKSDAQVVLQSKAGQPLTRYFPDVEAALAALPRKAFVLDGEIVIVSGGHLAFDDLLQRIHPAETRVRRLAAETPATFMAFDCLVTPRGRSLAGEPLSARREQLEAFFSGFDADDVLLSPQTEARKVAEGWLRELGGAGLDGVVCKRADLPYRSGLRDGMVKVKRLRTADCIVAGYRYAQAGGAIGSLLLGLVNDDGLIDHVGFSSSFTAAERTALKPIVEPLRGGAGFTGRAPGGPSRWSAGRNTEWVPLEPRLVCEVRYDHYSEGRFRHGTRFLRWRPDKGPAQCTFEQVEPRRQAHLLRSLGLR